MIKNVTLVFVGILALFLHSSFAQEDIEKIYLRKAVKAFVGKEYDNAIRNLKQTLVANPENGKAKKLMAKCFSNKGTIFLERGNIIAAERAFKLAQKFNPSNKTARAGLEQVQQAKANPQLLAAQQQPVQQQQATQPVSQTTPSSQQQVSGIQGVPTMQYPQSPQVIVNASSQGGADSNQTKIISALVNNFNEQQKLFGEQMKTSNSAMQRTEDSKDKYLDALVLTTEKNNTMMRNFLLIGGAITFGIFIVFFTIFFFIFRSVSKASDLRTVQANETLQLLLANPSMSNRAQGAPLMLTGPQGAYDGEVNQVNIDSLDTEDPVQRANAVEAVAAEIIDVKESSRFEKIKKLEELLNDENNRVRANAAKAIYEIDKDMALNTLQDMLDNPSKRMRASAVWALGEISSEEALNHILRIEDEDDEIVKYNIKVALGKIKSVQRFPFTTEHSKKIETALEAYKDMV